MALGVIVTVGLGAALVVVVVVVVEGAKVVEVETTAADELVGIKVHCPTRPSVDE